MYCMSEVFSFSNQSIFLSRILWQVKYVLQNFLARLMLPFSFSYVVFITEKNCCNLLSPMQNWDPMLTPREGFSIEMKIVFKRFSLVRRWSCWDNANTLLCVYSSQTERELSISPSLDTFNLKFQMILIFFAVNIG